MPMNRYEIRNEYSLADPELYRAADKDDPEALLEGVSMAGLVGVLRQLGDLAEFAAEIFHDLHEEVMATAARGHGLMIRVQQLEAEVPFIEKTFLSQTDHSSSFYNSGADWHPNIRISQNLVTEGDLPRFIMDSCEECRGPPRLFLLDKFDVGGAGACLKRYTDPSFFKVETSGMTGAEVQREKKIRKAKKKGPRWRNGETPEVLPASHAKLHQLFLDEHVENGAKNPARRAKLKRKLNGFPFDSKTGKSYMEKLLRTPSPNHKMVDEVVISSSSLMLPLNYLSDSGVDIPEVGPLSHYHEHVVEKSAPSTERGGLMVNSSTSESNEISTDDNMWEAHNSYNNIVINDISPTFDKQVTDEEDRPMDGERKTEGSLIGSQSDDISSEIDNYVDAPSTMGSEIDTDSELRMKGDFSSPYMKSKPSISDANEDRLHNRSSDSQSTGESTMSDEGFSSLKKEISSFSLSDSLSASVENSNPEKHYVEGFPAADIPEIDKVDASHPDEDFEKDQHGRPIFLDDTCRDTDVISDHIFDLHPQNSSVDQIISEPLPEPEEVVREGRLREPESSEIVDTLDDNEKDTEQVVHPTCSLSASDSESQLGDDSLGFPAGKHAGDETNGEAYTSNGNEIKPELVMLQTSSPCISDFTSESGDDSPRSSAGEEAIEESNSNNIFCTFTLSDTLCHTKDGSAAVSADLLPQDDPDQHDHDSPVSSDGEHPVDKLNSDDTSCASTVSEALHPTTEGLAAASADLLHEEDADQHDQYLIENESSTLISCEILSQKERYTPKMISMECPVPGKLEDDIPKMSDHHIAHSVEDILPTVSRGEKLLNELDHSKISSDASDYSGCISGSNPVKEFTEASLPEKQNLEDADNCSITAADNQMDPVNLISSHVEDAHSWPITGPCHGGTWIIPEEEATLSETPATGSSVSVEVVGLQEIETTDDSAVLENPLNLEVTAGASDIVEKDGIPEIPSGVEVTEILGSADLSSEKEGNVLLDKSDDVPPHEYTADPEHLGTLESLNEAHVILNESDGHIFPNKSDAVTKNESLADLKCPGDPEETAKSSIMLGSDGITSSPSGLKVTEIVGFTDVNSLNEVDVLLDESFSLKEHEDTAPVSSPLSAAADNSDTDAVNLPADLDKSVAGHNQCYDHSCLHVLGNDLNCLSGSPRESCLSENFSHREAATGAAFGVPLSTDQPKSEESDAASASCLDPVIEHSLQIPDDSTILTLEQSGFDTEQDSFQENDMANHVSGNDLNCLSGSQRESSLSSAFSHREDATLNPGSDINTPFSTDQPKSEGSDAVVACFDPIIDHSLQVGDDATIPSTLEQSGFDPEHDSFHENDTAYHVSGASYLPIDYNAERTVFQDKIELPPTQPDDEVLLAVEACSQLSTFCPSNPQQMPSPDDNEVDNKSDPTFPHVNNNPGPPSLSVFPGISNYEGNVPGNPMGLDSIFLQNSLFSETNHIKLDELPPLPPLPPVQWRMGKFQHISFTVDKEVVKQELPSERISPPTACTVEDNSYLEETHSSLIQIAPPLAPKEEKVELKMSDSAVNSLHEKINLPQDIGDKLQQPTASGNDVGSLLEEVNHSLTQIAPAIASKEEKVVNSSSSIEVDAIRETVKIILMTENQSLLSLPSNDDVTSLHGENNRSLIKISNQSSSSLETGTTEETSDPPLQPFMPSSEAKFASPEDKVQNESGTAKWPRPRNPLIDAVAAIDRSKLRKVTERVRPQVQKVDERDSILEQIRTKSFNLKPTVASRPSFRGPGTNLKVAAILEKANAIRQALAGSDEDDEDSWSDS